MDNRVYYGEYSLKHWIDIILKQNIILPEYQRYFVWREEKVKTLIDTFKKKEFVPPVTIGAFKNGNTNQNLILDGQQRLTSILLAYLGLFPDESTYKKAVDNLANENDDKEDDEPLDNIFEWTFKKLVEKGNYKQDILENIVKGNYKEIDLKIDDEFFKTTFLGFSYLVPHVADEKAQQNYYSSVFRNINIQGETLLAQQSRASLYFLDRDLAGFFNPEFFNTLVIKGIGNDSKADFVRYLSLLSQYYMDKSAYRVARGYKSNMEKYYEEYIYSVVADKDETYGKFSSIFPDRNYAGRFKTLLETIQSLEIPTAFASIIDLDVFLFGLIFEIVFENKKIIEVRKDDLIKDLTDTIKEFKSDSSHAKTPSAFKNLRARINASISIYKRYVE